MKVIGSLGDGKYLVSLDNREPPEPGMYMVKSAQEVAHLRIKRPKPAKKKRGRK